MKETRDACCTITVRSRLGDYPALIYESPEFLNELALIPNGVLVADRRVYELYRGMWTDAFGDRPVFLFEAEETGKTLDGASKLYEWLTGNFAAKRNLNLISFGGGITQDVTGFVASTLYRGIGWHFVPTTLLAQVDSCIGGKTSLNFRHLKNLLGTFYPPRKIYIWPGFCATLSELDLAGGWGEIIKFFLMEGFEHDSISGVCARLRNCIGSGGVPSWEAIRDCLNIKRSFMEEDEFDRGRRNLLNYGHCFGHALEAASDYHVPHGIAVNIGIMFANLAAVRRGTLTQSCCEAILREVNLPYLVQKQRPEDYDASALLENLKNDKKRTGTGLPLVIPAGDGLLRLNDFTEAEFHAVLHDLKAILFAAETGVEK